MSKDFWVEKVHVVGHLINRFPHLGNDGKTSEEMLSGNPINSSNLTIFSCLPYDYVKTDKLEPKAVTCVLVGNNVAVKGFKLLCTARPPTLLVWSIA